MNFCTPSSFYPVLRKNGYIHTGKQRFKCRACGRQLWKTQPTQRLLNRRALIDKLLLERLLLAAIVRVTGVSER